MRNQTTVGCICLSLLIIAALVVNADEKPIGIADVSKEHPLSPMDGKNGTTRYRPVVIMHGLFSAAWMMDGLVNDIKADYPGIHVLNAEIGPSDPRFDSLYIEVNQQVEMLAAQIQADPNLADGFDLIGHSQGGLLTRGYIQRYNNPVVHNYISLAGPQQGLFGIPKLNDWCPVAECPWLVDLIDEWSESDPSEPFFQEHVSFTQYWQNPLNYSLYLNTSGFLADINNQREVKNQTYKENFLNITGKAVFVMAEHDHVAVPKESELFRFYETGQDTVLYNLTSTKFYQEDWIGLRALDERGALEFLTANCTHQNMPNPPCKETVYVPIVKPLVGGVVD